MKYIIIAPKTSGQIKAVPFKKAEGILKRKEYYAMAQCDSKEQAHAMIMGLKAHVVVEKYAGFLSDEIKRAFKSEIAELSTTMYNDIVK